MVQKQFIISNLSNIMNYNIYYLHFILVFLFISCTTQDTQLEQALSLAGNNRHELEQVLTHYSHSAKDSLKLRAARFLIENMPGHYTLEGDIINKYREKIYADSNASYFSKRALEISMTHMKEIQQVSRKQEDARHIKAAFLIRHINLSFKRLEEYSWLQNIPFDLFLEYILPYRMGHERIDLWIDSLEISPISLEKLKHSDDLKYTIENINYNLQLKNLNKPISNDLIYQLCKNYIYNDCRFKAIYNNFYSRAITIPSAIDCIPYYANRNGYHYWNITMSPEARNTTIPMALERKSSKIYRRTYSRQFTLTPKEGEYIPEFFQDPFYKDVSNEYMYTANIHVHPYLPVKKTPNYAYLSVFCNLKWQPIAIGELTSTGADFKNMGKKLVYLPVHYPKRQMTPLHYPFILNLNEEIKYLIPDTLAKQNLRLYRKYPLSNAIYNYNKQLETTIIELSETSNFKSPDTLSITSNIAGTYCECILNSKKLYRHSRIEIPMGCACAEIIFLDSNNLPIPVQIDSTFIAGFDGNPLTNINRRYNTPNILANFPHPVQLSKIIILPRSDGNGIYPGEEYELLYHDLKGWQSLGRQIATDYYLDYNNVPRGALYWLHNRTKGVEERIFTVDEKGEIRFY